jgi:hypothetical protein
MSYTDPTRSRVSLDPDWKRSNQAMRRLLQHDGKNRIQRLLGKLGRILSNRERFKPLASIHRKIDAAPSSRN